MNQVWPGRSILNRDPKYFWFSFRSGFKNTAIKVVFSTHDLFVSGSSNALELFVIIFTFIRNYNIIMYTKDHYHKYKFIQQNNCVYENSLLALCLCQKWLRQGTQFIVMICLLLEVEIFSRYLKQLLHL